jgi:hypothetical protein
MNFFKALIPGALLTFIVSGLLGSGHSTGGWLSIGHAQIQHHTYYWSWPLFAVATGLAWILFTITPK